jgi:hypothetical protein
VKLKGKPAEIKRKSVNHEVELPYDVIVFDIVPHCIKQLVLEGYTEDELDILHNHDIKLDYKRGYYDAVDLTANFTLPESDQMWNRRRDAYNKRMEEYNTWCEENKDEIAEELAQREAQQKVNEALRLQREVDKLSAKLASNQQKLSRLQLD